MKINTLPFLEKKQKTEYFLSLILRNEKAKAVIFEKENDTIKYINQSEENFSNTIEDSSTEEFLNVLDKIISNAESVLPDSVETHKTIFALKESWIEDNKIKKEYLEKLKKAGDELALDPIGFLVFSESIINLLHKEEGAPVSAILAEVGNKFLTLSLVKGGKIKETRTSEIHQSAPFTVDTLLKHFQSSDSMPSRIILFDTDEEDIAQEFIGYSWSKSLPFLHIPQIVNLSEESDVKAVLLGASTQMGTSLIFDTSRPIVEETVEQISEDKKEVIKKEDVESLENIVRKQSPEEKKSGHELEYLGQEKSQDFFGFSATDVAGQIPKPNVQDVQDAKKENFESNIREAPEEVKLEQESTEGLGVAGVKTADKIKLFFESLPKLFKHLKFSKLLSIFKNMEKRTLLIVAGAIVIIFGLIFFFFTFSTKAEITLILTPKIEEKTTEATFSPGGETNIEEGILASNVVSVQEEGSTSTPATGKKDVGTNAKGTVTVFNISDNPISLTSGTEIEAPNGLIFTLDGSVKIASGSSDPLNPKSSTADVNVSAEDIGQEYNLPSGTKFSIGNNNSLAAKNDKAFSGGTKKNVTVVSKKDIEKVKNELPKSLSDKAKSDLLTRITDDKNVITDFVDTSLSGEKFSKKEGDETNQLSLSATVSFDFLTYNKEDVQKLAIQIFNNTQSVIDKNNIEVGANNIKTLKNNDVSADITIKAKLFPKIDTSNLSKSLAGQPINKAKNRLENIENVESVNIKITPNIPFLSSSLPKNSNNIVLKISSN